ncbi:MAG: pyrroline-5-carboxylate reductase [Candidatus Dormibacteria bacterium]
MQQAPDSRPTSGGDPGDPQIDPFQGSRLGVVGTGVMAEAVISGLLRQRMLAPTQVICSHPRSVRRDQLRSGLGVDVTSDNGAAVSGADLVLLAVKPQVLPRVLPEIAANLSERALVVSIVAGASTRVLGSGLGHPHLVRAMPNTPAQIGAGMTVWFSTPGVSPNDVRRAQLLLSALGEEIQVQDEAQVAMATAVSGTGPTYTLLFIEALIDAAVHLGFPRHVARRLVLATANGSVSFAAQSNKHVSELRDMVTSPGGTSAEALAALERGRFRTVLSDAVWAAYRRTVQLEATLETETAPPPHD